MLVVLKLLGSIALLIYGMKVMSEALQKMAGPGLRHLLGAMTTNRFSGVATGALVTVAVQSSAATTVILRRWVRWAIRSRRTMSRLTPYRVILYSIRAATCAYTMTRTHGTLPE